MYLRIFQSYQIYHYTITIQNTSIMLTLKSKTSTQFSIDLPKRVVSPSVFIFQYLILQLALKAQKQFHPAFLFFKTQMGFLFFSKTNLGPGVFTFQKPQRFFFFWKKNLAPGVFIFQNPKRVFFSEKKISTRRFHFSKPQKGFFF